MSEWSVARVEQLAPDAAQLDDPIDLLFATRLGGGTDINRAVAYCQTLVRAPQDTILVLISDLFEGGVEEEMLNRAAALATSGVQFIALLALSDEGAPHFNASWPRSWLHWECRHLRARHTSSRS